ncbi:hypothetical protein MMC22_011013 [Lobaria immixta]|nr:hypothetical protein [Lobaria immixta]
MGESRQELLAWLNTLLQQNITKVEQCGTGAPLCQIFDSIFQDLPMRKVNFNANTEYEYLQNFKILQNAFTKHKIERIVPVPNLIKCKMQDNLEFLQWSKRYWDQYYPGGDYDALARRPKTGTAPTPAPAVSSRTSGAGAGAGAGAARRGVTPTTAPTPRTKWSAGGGGGGGNSAVAAENTQLKDTVAGLERERDFYFSKLREIEVLLQQAVEADPDIEKDEDGLIKAIQVILYSTEEGFEIPAEVEGAVVQDDQETF